MKNCEICNSNIGRHRHHIHSVTFGGTNDKYNICRLCPNCHDSVHRSLIILEGKFLTSTGYKLLYHTKEEESITNREPKCFVF